MYTTGKFHKSAIAFLKDLAQQAAERRHIGANVIYNYYVKILSVCLIKRIGYTISQKTTSWLSKNANVIEAFRLGNERALEIGGTEID